MLRQARHERHERHGVAHALVCHPDTPSPAVTGIRAQIARRSPEVFSVSFRAVGAVEQVIWPGEATAGHQPWTRRDELWRHSCFEAFGAVSDRPEYFELNFTTSGQWAAYGFADVRTGMREANEVSIAAGNWRIASVRADLNAVVQVPPELAESDWLIGLTAVIEATDGTRSYWALAHGDGPPDFHNRDCFTATLPALGRP